MTPDSTDRHHPLAHRLSRKHGIGEMGGELRRAPAVAGAEDATAFTGEKNRHMVSAACKPSRGNRFRAGSGHSGSHPTQTTQLHPTETAKARWGKLRRNPPRIVDNGVRFRGPDEPSRSSTGAADTRRRALPTDGLVGWIPGLRLDSAPRSTGSTALASWRRDPVTAINILLPLVVVGDGTAARHASVARPGGLECRDGAVVDGAIAAPDVAPLARQRPAGRGPECRMPLPIFSAGCGRPSPPPLRKSVRALRLPRTPGLRVALHRRQRTPKADLVGQVPRTISGSAFLGANEAS